MEASCLHIAYTLSLLQKCGGQHPSGFVATEFQEWFRLKVLPAIKDHAGNCFKKDNSPPWFKWSLYQAACAAVGHTPTRYEPFFLVSQDSDPRHSMSHFWPGIDSAVPPHGSPPDRRLIPRGQVGHIPINKVYNYVPSAPKVPDSVQFAIESLFASVKRRYFTLMLDYPDSTPKEMVDMIRRAFAEVATPETIRNCCRHSEENMRIFCGKESDTVTIDGTVYHCTDGNWLPKCRRG